eukprot:GHVS01048517.1.p1 GENE.GHVS01048517.1~~GHVS01048517.1.p1  ORF type:complete len:298 (+),score=114.80 GHVS01048517.1:269-1162(+)
MRADMEGLQEGERRGPDLLMGGRRGRATSRTTNSLMQITPSAVTGGSSGGVNSGSSSGGGHGGGSGNPFVVVGGDIRSVRKMVGSRRRVDLPLADVAVNGGGAVVLSDERLSELKEAFDLFDIHGRGRIDARELKAALRALGYRVEKEHVDEMVRQTNRKKKTEDEEWGVVSEQAEEGGGDEKEDVGAALGEICFEDFVAVLTTEMAARETKEEIRKVFKLFDVNNRGLVGVEELRAVCQEIGEDSVTEEQLCQMVEEADKTGKGSLSFHEFYKVMKIRGNELIDVFDSSEEEEEGD